MKRKNIVIALDLPNYDEALRLAAQLSPYQCRVKVGKALFTRCGPRVVNALHNLGFDVFLDLKYHDIPNTVAEAVEAAADLGVWMVNVHALGGAKMLKAAKSALEGRHNPPLLIAVTVLTSTDHAQWQQLGYHRDIATQASYLAELTAHAGLDGVVCSALEVQQIKVQFGDHFLTVTPGVRPHWAHKDDQARTVTPSDACHLGSDYLVIGRPITRATRPKEALARILSELNDRLEDTGEKL